MRITTKSILYIVIIFLVGTNVSTYISLTRHIKTVHSTSNTTYEIPSTQIGKFFKDTLKLDETQQAQFRNFRRTYHQRANHVLFEMGEIRVEMAAQLKNVSPNRSELDALSNQLGEKHELLKNYTFDYYYNLQSVLNELQQVQMVDIFQAMLTDEGNAHTPSHQRPGGNFAPGKGQGRNQTFRSQKDTINNTKNHEFN